MGEKKELRTVKPEDLFQLKFLQDGQLPPDGKSIAYAVSHIDAEEEERVVIWLLWLETGESRQLQAEKVPIAPTIADPVSVNY